MHDDFISRIAAVDWAACETAYGVATDVPGQLIKLASSDRPQVMDAAHHLWCGLCHQHAYISSAALPAFPFIVEILDNADDDLAVEILDILVGFAVCSTLGPDGPSPDHWKRVLRQKLQLMSPRFKTLVEHHNEYISSFAEMIVESLTNYPT